MDAEVGPLPRTEDAVVEETIRAVGPAHQDVVYAVYGDPAGDPVVLVHPTPGTRRFGRLLADEAAELGIRLIVPERPGYGVSDTRTLVGPLTVSLGLGDVTSQVGVLRGVLRDVGVQEFGLLGVSSGCPFALALATEGPDRVTDLALVSTTTPPDGPGVNVPIRRGARDLSPIDDGPGEGSPEGLSTRVATAFGRRFRDWSSPVRWLQHHSSDLSTREVASVYGDPDRLTPVAATLRLELLAALRDPLVGYAVEKQFLDRTWGVDFGAVDADPVVLGGTDDDHTPPAAGRYLARRLDGADFGTVDGEGHLSTLLSTAGTVLRHATGTLSIDRDPTE